MRVAIVALLMLAWVRIADADVITEERAQCSDKQAGDACGEGSACVQETCSRMGPDGVRVDFECLSCRAGAPRKPSPSHADVGSGSGSESGSGSGSKGLYIGIAVAVSLIVCGLAFAYTRRRKPGA